MIELPQRKRRWHTPPDWVRNGASYFLTVCCTERGKPQLTKLETFEVMVNALEHYVGSGRWWMELFLAMPDHWHAIGAFPQPESMERVLRDWKRYVAKKTGVLWQDGFFDHRLRSPQSAQEKWHYIRLNPVRKGLVTEPKAWPYQWMPAESGALGITRPTKAPWNG